jgi:hypothetical protein
MHYIFQDHHGETHELSIQELHYDNQRIALAMFEQGELYTKCTINVPTITISKEEVIIDNYDQNRGVLQFLIDNEVVTPPLYNVQIGEYLYPVCKYKGVISVDPDEVSRNCKIKIKGEDKYQRLIYWNSIERCGVYIDEHQEPVGIELRDIERIFK